LENIKKMEQIKMLLTIREARLIMTLRELRYGKVEIDIRDGVPQPKIKQKEKIIDLDKGNYPELFDKK